MLLLLNCGNVNERSSKKEIWKSECFRVLSIALAQSTWICAGSLDEYSSTSSWVDRSLSASITCTLRGVYLKGMSRSMVGSINTSISWAKCVCVCVCACVFVCMCLCVCVCVCVWLEQLQKRKIYLLKLHFYSLKKTLRLICLLLLFLHF